MSRGVVLKGGKVLPELSRPAGAEDIRSGMQAIGAEGAVITGTKVIQNFFAWYDEYTFPTESNANCILEAYCPYSTPTTKVRSQINVFGYAQGAPDHPLGYYRQTLRYWSSGWQGTVDVLDVSDHKIRFQFRNLSPRNITIKICVLIENE